MLTDILSLMERMIQSKKNEMGINTPIGKLMENPEAEEVLKKYFKDALHHPKFDMVKSLSLPKLKKFAKGMISDEMLADIEKDLKKINFI